MRPRFLVAAPAAAVLLLTLSQPSAAQPSPTPTPPQQQSEVQAAVAGNATTCQKAGLPGNLLLFWGGPTSSFNGTVRGTVRDEKVLDVTTIDNAVISGVLVDGGPRYNIYTTAPFVGLTPPVDETQNIQQINYWMVCGWELPSGRPEGAVVPYGAPYVPTQLPAGVGDAGPSAGDDRIGPVHLPNAARSESAGPPWALLGLATAGVITIGAVIVGRRRHADEM
jgi:hypothetical protein